MRKRKVRPQVVKNHGRQGLDLESAAARENGARQGERACYRGRGFNRLPCCRRAIRNVGRLLSRSLFRLVDESPRWLFAHGRRAEADGVVRRMLARNGRAGEIPAQGFFDAEHLRKALGSEATAAESDERRTHGIVDLFRTPRLRLRTLNVAFNW